MYLEMFKGKDVVIEVVEKEPSSYEDFSKTQMYKLTELAKFLKAKTVKVNGDTDGKYVIRYYYGEIPNPTNAEVTLDVYWDEANDGLILENIWIKGDLIGRYKEINGNSRSLKPNKVMRKEQFAYFDIRLLNYDFTQDKKGREYTADILDGRINLKCVK